MPGILPALTPFKPSGPLGIISEQSVIFPLKPNLYIIILSVRYPHLSLQKFSGPIALISFHSLLYVPTSLGTTSAT